MTCFGVNPSFPPSITARACFRLLPFSNRAFSCCSWSSEFVKSFWSWSLLVAAAASSAAVLASNQAFEYRSSNASPPLSWANSASALACSAVFLSLMYCSVSFCTARFFSAALKADAAESPVSVTVPVLPLALSSASCSALSRAAASFSSLDLR